MERGSGYAERSHYRNPEGQHRVSRAEASSCDFAVSLGLKPVLHLMFITVPEPLGICDLFSKV